MFPRVPRFATIALCAIVALPAFAGVTGSISGRAVDPSGAVVPNTTLALTSTDTAAVLTAVSGSNGEFHFLALPVGHYTLRATRSGFSPFEEKNIVINANDALTIDVALKVGNETQSVEVQANALHVETTSSQMGSVIDSQTIVDMPLNGRSYTDLLGLQTGVAPASAGTVAVSFIPGFPIGTQGAGNLAVSGSRETDNGYVVNGGSVEDPFTNGTSVVPNIDAIEEFRLLTNNFDAEYGHFGGGLVNVVTKSGTNSLHGNGFLFVRNQGLDASNFFDTTKGDFSRYQPGGTIGGPIKRDKLFFFVDYQGTRENRGLSTGLVQVPTASQRSGVVDPATITGAVNGSYWANILSQRLNTVVSAGEPYSTLFPTGTIPQAAFSPVAINVLPFYPAGNAQGFYSGLNQTNTRDDRGGVRIDLIGKRLGTLSGYYFIDDSNISTAYGLNNIPGWPSGTVGRSQQANIGDTRSFGSKSVNEARFNYSHYNDAAGKPLGGIGSAASIGINGYAIIPGIIPGVPNFNIQGITAGIGIPPGTVLYSASVYEGLENFSRVVGTHSLKFGGEFHYTQFNADFGGPGNFGFDGVETGDSFADFLLGAPSTFGQSSPALNNSRTKYGGAYGQDSWHAGPNLTLNYGLRWEVSQPWYEKENRYATLIPGEQSVIFPTAPLGLVFPTDKGVARGIAPTRWHSFSPRLGLVYVPWSQSGAAVTSIRASFGIFYTSMESFGTFFNNAPPPYEEFYIAPTPNIVDDPYTNRATGGVNHPFPFITPIPGTQVNFSPYLPINYYPFLTTNAVSPYSESFSLSVQQELDARDVLTISYAGNQGHHYLASSDVNEADPALCLSVNQISQVAPGGQTCGPFGENSTFIRADGTVIASTRPALGPVFGSMATLHTIANSNYNSMEVSLSHQSQMARFFAGYTWGKAMDNTSSLSDQGLVPGNPRFTRGLSSYDISQNVVVSYAVQLPFGQLAGGHWASVTGGWQLSGITRLSTGFPIRIGESDDQDLLGLGGVISGGPDVPNYRTGDLNLGKSPLSGQPYFNTSLFSEDVLGQFGNSNPRFFHGPGIVNFDTALSKSFRIKERFGVLFRAEFFDVFNHPEFMNPSGNINSGSFGILLSARDPRIGQIAVKATF
jgi:Carboxypeptidase regulatory-like domain/TonB dependent receptor